MSAFSGNFSTNDVELRCILQCHPQMGDLECPNDWVFRNCMSPTCDLMDMAGLFVYDNSNAYNLSGWPLCTLGSRLNKDKALQQN